MITKSSWDPVDFLIEGDVTYARVGQIFTNSFAAPTWVFERLEIARGQNYRVPRGVEPVDGYRHGRDRDYSRRPPGSGYHFAPSDYGIRDHSYRVRDWARQANYYAQGADITDYLIDEPYYYRPNHQPSTHSFHTPMTDEEMKTEVARVLNDPEEMRKRLRRL